MQAAQQTTTTTAPLMKFFGSSDRQAWLNGRTPDQLEIWEQACVECGYIPPATEGEFLAATKDDAVYPDLEAWRVAFVAARAERFEADLRAKLEASGAPKDVIDQAVAQIRDSLGDRVAGVSADNIDVQTIKRGADTSADDLGDMGPELLASLLGKEEASPEKLVRLIRLLVDVEKAAERAACAKLVEALDPVAGKRFADVIRFRDKEEKARRQCDCAKCTAKRAAGAESTIH